MIPQPALDDSELSSTQGLLDTENRPRALVRMDRDVPEAALRAAIEGEGYRVVSVSPRVSSL